MNIYRGRGKEINEAWRKLGQRSALSADEVYRMLVGLQGNHFPLVFYIWWQNNHPLVFLYHEEENKFEIVYDQLTKESIEFMQKYFPYILMTQVIDIEAWMAGSGLEFLWRR